jgi:hypothetical protein
MMDTAITKKQERKLSFKFHPFNIDNNEHFIEKAEKGVRRKYLRGISSGIMRDGHGERMTARCIKDMMDQGQSRNVLLYAGLHGVNFIDDLGKLVDSNVVNNSDWFTEYRLFDELDGLDEITVGRADKLWKQITGKPPYNKPAQKGFSIEGTVPEESILEKDVLPDGSYANRVIDKVLLDGVVVVNRPAYEDSVATAIYKCLGELVPEAAVRIRKGYHDSLFQEFSDKEAKDNYYQKFFRLNNTLEEKISDIMSRDDTRNRERLEILLDEYKSIIVNLVMQNQSVFLPDDDIEVGVTIQAGTESVVKGDLMKALAQTSLRLGTLLSKRIGRTA